MHPLLRMRILFIQDLLQHFILYEDTIILFYLLSCMCGIFFSVFSVVIFFVNFLFCRNLNIAIQMEV
jgi:hypothetical protein